MVKPALGVIPCVRQSRDYMSAKVEGMLRKAKETLLIGVRAFYRKGLCVEAFGELSYARGAKHF